MIDLVIFALISIAVLAAPVLLFLFKDILHAVLALSALFFFNSLVFLLLGQPLLAVIQLFVMVGGVSTFLFVGAASGAYPNFKYNKLAVFVIIGIILFAVVVYPLNSVQFTGTGANQFNSQDIAFQLEASSPIFYLMALVMFSVCFGSVLLLKKIGAIK
jgi:NADH-quinone oxidoreductase subunit J